MLEKNINVFQETVWNSPDDESEEDNEVWKVLCDLAYDLDFFEPDPEVRREDFSLYGEERAFSEIRNALEKIDKYRNANQSTNLTG